MESLISEETPPVAYATFAPNGKFVLSACLDSTIKLWNLQNKKPFKTYKGGLQASSPLAGQRDKAWSCSDSCLKVETHIECVLMVCKSAYAKRLN